MWVALGGVFRFLLASPLCRRASCVAVCCFCFCLCASIRVMPSCFMRRPCAGQAKESGSHRQLFFLPAGPLRTHTSHGNVSVRMHCRRSVLAHHPLRAPVVAVSRTERFRPYCGKLCVGCTVVARFRVRSEACAVLRPTHTLPPGGRMSTCARTCVRVRSTCVARSCAARDRGRSRDPASRRPASVLGSEQLASHEQAAPRPQDITTRLFSRVLWLFFWSFADVRGGSAVSASVGHGAPFARPDALTFRRRLRSANGHAIGEDKRCFIGLSRRSPIDAPKAAKRQWIGLSGILILDEPPTTTCSTRLCRWPAPAALRECARPVATRNRRSVHPCRAVSRA